MWTKKELEKKTKEELINIIIKMQIDIQEERDEIYRRRLLDTFRKLIHSLK